MSKPTNAQSDLLNSIGHAILEADTRWIIIGAAGFLVLYLLALRLVKGHWASRDDAVSLALALLQLYSAPVLFCMLVLTQPPAVDRVGDFQRQGAGLLAFIFLVAGVFMQIRKVWTGGSTGQPSQPQVLQNQLPAGTQGQTIGGSSAATTKPAQQPAEADGIKAPCL